MFSSVFSHVLSTCYSSAQPLEGKLWSVNTQRKQCSIVPVNLFLKSSTPRSLLGTVNKVGPCSLAIYGSNALGALLCTLELSVVLDYRQVGTRRTSSLSVVIRKSVTARRLKPSALTAGTVYPYWIITKCDDFGICILKNYCCFRQ